MLVEHKLKLKGVKDHALLKNSRKTLIGTTIGEQIIAEAENLEKQGLDKVAIFGHVTHALAILGAAHMNAIAVEDAGKPKA